MFSSNSNNSNSKQSASDFLASNKYSLNGSKQTDTSWMFPKQASLSVPEPNVSFQSTKVPQVRKVPEFSMSKISASTPFLGQSNAFEHSMPKPPSFVDIKFSEPKISVLSQDYRAAQQENFMMQQRIMDNNRIAMENNRAAMEMNLANMRNQRMNFEQAKSRMPSMDDFGENFGSSYEGQKTISKLKEWHLGLEKAKRDQSFYKPNLASKDYDEIDSVKKSSGKVEGKKFRGLEPKDFAGGRITPRQYAKLLFGDDKIDNKLVINQQGIQNVDKETKEFSEYLNSFVDGNLSQEQKNQRELRVELNEMIRNHPYKLRRKNQLEEGVVNSLVIGAGRAYVEIGQGAKQFAMEIGEKVGIVDANAVQKYSESIAREKELYVLTPVAKSTAGKAGEFAGNTVIFSAVPCGSGLKGYKLAASSAASGAVVMGLHPVEDGQGLRERGRNAAVGAAAAVVVAPAVGKFAEVSNKAIVRLYERGRASVLNSGVSYKGGKVPEKSISFQNVLDHCGSGHAPGVISISPNSRSFKALDNYTPKKGIEFVYDPERKIFAVGKVKNVDGQHELSTLSFHQRLAKSIGANENTVLGGTLSRTENGTIKLTEHSGHYGARWKNNDIARQEMLDLLSKNLESKIDYTPWGQHLERGVKYD